MKKPKNKVKHVENPLEKLFGGGLEDILGLSSHEEKQTKSQGELVEGQEINFKKLQEEKNEEPQVEAGIDYLRNYSREISFVAERAVSRENQELEAQLKEIMTEIKKLADSSKELQMQFKEIAVEQHATAPGKYHKNFFSWLLSIIKAARMKVEDSGAWLTAMQSKKKARGYNEMAKKHGTSFSLSNERNVSTQVG